MSILFPEDPVVVDGNTLSWELTSSSCSSYLQDPIYLQACSGTVLDSYRYPSLQQNDDLWRCEGCGAVHRVKDTLECDKCGMFITEKSRFVLK